jgi:hypothetical protein
VTVHSYHHLYALYLGPLRHRRIHILEIGLGCDQAYGPGKSIALWRDFLPSARIDMLEHDRECALDFTSQVDRMFVGDQANLTFLREIAHTARYDLIVDDGGHTRKQQIRSLLGLWSCVKENGGVYVIEDIFTSVTANTAYIDYDVSTVEVVFHLISLFNGPAKFRKAGLDGQLRRISETLLSVNCFSEACVLVKR